MQCWIANVLYDSQRRRISFTSKDSELRHIRMISENTNDFCVARTLLIICINISTPELLPSSNFAFLAFASHWEWISAEVGKGVKLLPCGILDLSTKGKLPIGGFILCFIIFYCYLHRLWLDGKNSKEKHPLFNEKIEVSKRRKWAWLLCCAR